MNVGPQGLLVLGLPAPFVQHSASLGPATATRVLSALVPVSAPPTGLDVCLFFVYLVSDFLVVDFPSVLVVRGGAVCLPTPPSWFSLFSFSQPVRTFTDSYLTSVEFLDDSVKGFLHLCFYTFISSIFILLFLVTSLAAEILYCS